jgi:hypothetical protein
MKQRAAASLAVQSAPWWQGETAISVSAIPQHVPARPDGDPSKLETKWRPVSAATAWRWTLRGIGGVRIRRFRTGGTWCTTLQELARWQAALTEAAVVA